MFSKTFSITYCVLFGLLSFCSLHNGVGGEIMCYDCISEVDPACSDPVDTSKIDMKTCGDDYNCIKTIYKLDSKTVTMRGCNLATLTCEMINPTSVIENLTELECSTCASDHCNNGMVFQVSIFMIFIVSLFSFVL